MLNSITNHKSCIEPFVQYNGIETVLQIIENSNDFIILNDRHLKHTKWIMLKPSHWPSKNQALLHAKIKRKNISSCCWTIWKNVNSSICSLRAPEERCNQYRAVLHLNSIAEQSALATIFQDLKLK